MYYTVEGSWRPVEGVGVRLRLAPGTTAPGFGGGGRGGGGGGGGGGSGGGRGGGGGDNSEDDVIDAPAPPPPITLRARRVGARRVELTGALTQGGEAVSFWRRV